MNLSRTQWTGLIFAGLLAMVFVFGNMFSFAGADREVQVTQCEEARSGDSYSLNGCGTAEELDATLNDDIAYHTESNRYLDWKGEWHAKWLQDVKGFSVDTGCYNEYSGFSLCTDSQEAADYIKDNFPKSYDRSGMCPGDNDCIDSSYEYIIGVQGVSSKVASALEEQASCTTSLTYEGDDDATASLTKEGSVSVTQDHLVCLHSEAKTSEFEDAPSEWYRDAPRLIKGGDGVSFSFDSDFTSGMVEGPGTGDGVNDAKSFFEKIWSFIKSLNPFGGR